MRDLNVGRRVTLKQQTGQRVKESFTIADVERHEGSTFYRLNEIEGGLFLRDSLTAV